MTSRTEVWNVKSKAYVWAVFLELARLYAKTPVTKPSIHFCFLASFQSFIDLRVLMISEETEINQSGEKFKQNIKQNLEVIH